MPLYNLPKIVHSLHHMNFPEFLGEFVRDFQPQLDTHSDRLVQYAARINPQSGTVARSCLRLIQSGGKRIRPALAVLGYWLMTTEKPHNSACDTLYTVGTALELLHTFALIHDDIIDKAVTRRGTPTIEAEYAATMTAHDAMTAALLAGDYLHTYANSLMMNIEPSSVRKMYFDLSMELMCGQVDDCLGIGQSDFENLDEDRVRAMLAAKSGNYTIQKPLLLGAEIARAHTDVDDKKWEEKQDILRQVGHQLGIIFQHTDDILGIFGTQETGKSVDTDIMDGKRTLLMSRVFTAASQSECAWLKTILGNHSASQSDIQSVRDYIQASGVIGNIHTEAEKLIEGISADLQTHFEPSPAREALQSLGTFLLQRTQ